MHAARAAEMDNLRTLLKSISLNQLMHAARAATLFGVKPPMVSDTSKSAHARSACSRTKCLKRFPKNAMCLNQLMHAARAAEDHSMMQARVHGIV